MSEDLEARLTRLARTPATPAMSLSPDGRRVVFSSSLGGLLQAWTVPAEGGAAERLLELHEPVHQVAWSPDGRWVGLVVAPGGGMNTQVHVVRPDGTGHRRLTAGGSETNQLTGWSPRGHLLLATNERVAAGMEVLLVDPDTGDRRVVTRLDGVGGATDVSPDGGVALVYRVRQRGDSDIVAVDLRTGEEVPLTP